MMSRIFARSLQGVIVAFGLGALTFLLWEPHVEGVNANAPFFAVYRDPFVLFAYLAAIPLFVMLYHGFRLAGFLGLAAPSPVEAARSLRVIKFAALTLLGFVLVSVLFMIGADPEDRPAGLFLRLLVAVPALIVALTAARFERSAPRHQAS